MASRKKLVAGVGTYEPGKFAAIEPGMKYHTGYYQTWRDMLKRCYSKQDRNYEGYGVASEWLNFQTFAQWLEDNEYREWKRLDKDLFSHGRKWYGPDTCCLLPTRLNVLLARRHSDKGPLPIGVDVHKAKYRVRCNDVKGKRVVVGLYADLAEAAMAYRNKKIEVVQEVATIWHKMGAYDEDVLEALMKWTPDD